MKKLIQSLKNKINKPLVTFLGAVAILVLVSNMETTTVEKAKQSVNNTVNKISKKLNSAASGDDSHSHKSTHGDVDSTKNTATKNYENKLAVKEESVVKATNEIIKSDSHDSVVKSNKTAYENELNNNGQNLLKANISMN